MTTKSKPPKNPIGEWAENFLKQPAPALASPTKGAPGLAAEVLGCLGRVVGRGLEAVVNTLAAQAKRIAELEQQLAQAQADAREAGLRELIALLRAEIKTLKSYLADREEQLRRYEIGAAWEKSREKGR